MDSTQSGYASTAIHVRMLHDQARTLAYRRAIEAATPGKLVAEIGAGSGILSCFAAHAGARKVYAIEETSIIDIAKEVAVVNGLSGRIEFIQGRAQEVELPERVDVLVAELIGNDPLAEGVLQTHADGSARFLKPHGISIPASLRISAIGIDSETRRDVLSQIDHEAARGDRLTSVYGLDLTPLVRRYRAEMAHTAASDPFFADLGAQATVGRPRDRIITDPAEIDFFDLSASTPRPARWQRTLELVATERGDLNAVAIFWTICLDAANQLGPDPTRQNETHWGGQMILPVPTYEVDPGARITITADIDLTRTPSIACKY